MSIKFVPLEQGSDAWKEFRKFKIGSSLAASIMGVGFKTPLQLFEDIMEDKETPDNEAMARGRRLEPIAREFLNHKFQAKLEPVVVQHNSGDWHFSSIDGFFERPGSAPFVVEIKCPGKVDHQIALSGKVPEKYLHQCYHILEDLPGVDRMLYFSYHEDSQAEVWVFRDEEAMKKQLKEEFIFYNKLLYCLPPEPSEKDWISFDRIDLVGASWRYSELVSKIQEMQDEASAIKMDLIAQLGNVKRAKIGDLRLQKVIRAGSVDYSKIEALNGLDLNLYRKDPIVTWRASL